MNNCRLESIPANLIDPGERARKEYRNIEALAEDINSRGLIHPIAVMDMDGRFLLLAGGRRLAACNLNRAETIDCKIFPSTLTDLEVKSIELMENIQREDLTYYEEASLEREILNLQEHIYGKKISTSLDAVGVSKSDVAKLIGVSREKLRQDVDLIETMEKFPEINWKGMKNRSEAMKLKDNIGKMIVRQEAVKQFNAEIGDKKKNQQIKKLADSFICGDFFDTVKQIPNNQINLVEIDPPYGINLGNIKKTDSKNYSYSESGYNEIDSAEYPAFMQKVFRECYRVMAPDSFLICWFGPEPWFQLILDLLRAEHFKVRGMPCIWVKGEETEDNIVGKTSGQTRTPMRHLANAYEMFFYAKKGDPKIVKQGRSNVFSFKPVPPTQKIHPTERPIELIKEILLTFTIENSKILVPFLGSGKTILAANEVKMNAFGCDLGIEYKEAYISKLNELLQ